MKRSHLRRGLATLAALTLLLPAGTALAAPTPPSLPDFLEAARHTRSGADQGSVDVMITLRQQVTTPSRALERSNLRQQDALVKEWASAYGLKVGRQFGFLANAIAATVPASAMSAIAADPRVESVTRQVRYVPFENEARELEGVSQALAQDSSLDGTGMVVSVIDTGIDVNHHDLQLDEAECDSTGRAKIKKIQPGYTCKVPAGYNYADVDADPTDTSATDQHGMHVAGIVGATGDPDEGGVRGVAPGAQLLAMKVFSNHGQYASEPALLAAVEDSVKLGADVINMSLGSTNGISRPSHTMALMLSEARQAGVVPVIAAGNEGQNFSSSAETGDVRGQWDDGTVGSPAVYDAALSVASVENSTIVGLKALATADGESRPAQYRMVQGTVDDTDHPLVDGALGRTDEVPASAAGKWVLIKRGENYFSDKLSNAVKAGAAGVVLWNHEDGGDVTIGVAPLEGAPEGFAAVTVGYHDGLRLHEALTSGKSASIRFTTERHVIANPEARHPSAFTSWGSSSTLDFAPQIAGIGGNVYSLQNNGTYGNMSGTSMASPNVAGLSALVLQHLRRVEGVTDRSATLADDAEALLVNTAERLTDPASDGLPYPVRQIGAGLARVDRAVASEVVATVDGSPTLALRQLAPGSTGTHTVTLRNLGDTPRSFSVDERQPVYGETNEVDAAPRTVTVADASVTASTTSVTVPAHGTATVTFTLSAGSATGFREGWLDLRSTDGGTDLAVPYFGFVGDWNAEQILATADDPLIEADPDADPDSQAQPHWYTYLATTYGEETTTGLEGTDRVWISPNEDGEMDSLTNSALLLRNAGELRFGVYAEDGTRVAALGDQQFVPRSMLSSLLSGEAQPLNGPSFSGKVYDPSAPAADGEDSLGADREVPVPDGRYVYRIEARLGAEARLGGADATYDWDWQTYDLPFGVDSTAPQASLGTYDAASRSVTLTASDATSGIHEVTAELNGTRLPASSIVRGTDGTYTISTGDVSPTLLTVTVTDFAMNATTVRTSLDASYVTITGKSALPPVLGNRAEGLIDPDTGALTVNGEVGPAVARATVNGQDVAVEDGHLTTAVTLQDGPNTITLTGYDAKGAVVGNDTLEVLHDAKPAVITVTNLDENGNLKADAEGNIHVEGTVVQEPSLADPLTGTPAITLDLLGQEVPLGPGGTFSTDITVTPDLGLLYQLIAMAGLPLDAYDGTYDEAPNETFELFPVDGLVSEADATGLTYTSPDCNEGSGMCVVNSASSEPGAGTVHFGGEMTKNVTRVVATLMPRAKDGAITPTPLTATLDHQAGTWSVDVPGLSEAGLYNLRVQAWADPQMGPEDEGTPSSADERMVSDTTFLVVVDAEVPTLSFTTPEVVDGTVYLRQSGPVRFAGTASDNAWGYWLALGSDELVSMMDQAAIGADDNRRPFEASYDLEDGDVISLMAGDMNDNYVVGHAPVVVDETDPVVNGVPDSHLLSLTAPKDLTFTASDAHLESLSLLVDGKPVDVLNTGATRAPLQSVMVNVNDLPETSGSEEEDGDAPVEGASRDRRAAALRAARADASGTETDTGAEQPADADAGEPSETVTRPTELTVTVPASALSAGRHTVELVATDFAGRRTSEHLAVSVDAPVTIDGPDLNQVRVDATELDGDQATLLADLLGDYSAVDPDGAFDANGQPVAGQPTLAWAEGTRLAPGTNVVTLVATAADGSTVTREVRVEVRVTARAQADPAGSAAPSDPQGANQPTTSTPRPGTGSAAADLSGPRGSLARTGTDFAGLLVAEAMVLTALGVIILRRRRLAQARA